MRVRVLAWVLWSTAIVLAAIGGTLVLLTLDAPVPDNWGVRGYWDVLAMIVATPGLLVALRRPENAIGWLLLVAGTATGASGVAQEYVTYGVVAHAGSLPAAIPIAWINSWGFSLSVTPLLFLIPQLFPTGRPLSRRWRPLLWASLIFIPVSLVVFGLRPGPLENATSIENPLAVTGTLAALRTTIEQPLSLAILLIAVGAAATLVLRWRRANGAEREQLKWIALSGGFLALGFFGVVTWPASKLAQVVMVAAFMTFPIAIAVAILRYRLYDIDLIINRTIVYGVLSAILAAAYVGFVVTFQALLRPITGGSEIAVAASTLAVIALVQPLRRRIQGAVDRRFYRSRYDAQQIVDTFTARLREEVDLDDVRTQLLGAVHGTVQPRVASLWLKEQAP